MCGIAGLCRFDGAPVDERVLRAMSERLAHRGPDGDGVFLEQGMPAVGLASRRLAVVDLPGGAQPMSTVDDALTIVYNGELFNTDELRLELQSCGRRFTTRSDTEVILHGYAEWGVDVLDHLNGMWAFALWDRPQRRLFVSRDRLGVKPLVYALGPGSLAFASEIKALTDSGAVERGLDITALPHYLSFFAVPEPYTLVPGVRRLPAGHALLADASGTREYRYWDCNLSEEDEDRGAAAYRTEVGELLEDSVRRRLVSDVDLGVLLSGGVDSRLVATFAARHQRPLRTFTLGFGIPTADERRAAATTAAALGACHTDRLVDPNEAARAYTDLVVAYDEPGHSLVQTHLISRLARGSVTVALSGLGGDELYSGYPTHSVVNMLGRLDRLPGALRSTVLALAQLTPGARGKALLRIAAMEGDGRASGHLLHQTSAELRSGLLSEEVRSAVNLDGPEQHLEEHFQRAAGRDPLNRLLYVYLKTYLTNELLRATDAMSMLNGLEIRTPMLDYRLVEHAIRIPARHKMALTRGKLVLRALAAGSLPGGVARRKQGFSPPLRPWLDGVLRDPVSELLDPGVVRRRGVFDPTAVSRVLQECRAGNDRMIAPVMMCFSFEAWAQGALDRTPPPLPSQAPVEIRTEPRKVSVPPVASDPDVSVIVVNWNTRDRLRACLASIELHLAPVSHEVVVVDNASDDGSAEMVTETFPHVRLLRNGENLGFARANNQAMGAATGRWLLLLNSDTELLDDSVARLLRRLDAEDERIGVAQCRLIFADGRLQQSAYRFPHFGLVLLESLGLHRLLGRRRAGEMLLNGYWDYKRERDVDWVSGAFMLMPREVFEQTGGFDERHFMYGEDLELSYRIRDHGWRIRYYPSAQIVHHDHSSSDVRWGGRPIELCLQTERDVIARRDGARAARAIVAARLVGAALHDPYYRLRARLPSQRSATYAEMGRYTTRVRRALLAIARERG